MQYTGYVLFLVQCWYLIEQTYGHGYLAEPPARSSAWLFDSDFRACCIYYDHAQMSCGGTYHQWTVNKGKCSICGEPHDRKRTLFGVGNPLYLGKIVRTYTQGSVIPVTIILTANHLGLFEFRVCNIDSDPEKDATQNCLDLNVLKTINGSTQYRVAANRSVLNLQVTLPPDLVCKHCVFQWKYQTGNSWGVSNGRACLGCGKENEEFYGCSDIAIVSKVESMSNSTTKAISNTTTKGPTSTITTTQTTTVPTTSTINATTVPTTSTIKTTTATTRSSIKFSKCTSTMTFSQSFDISSILGKYCQDVCSSNCASDNIIGNELRYHGCIDTCNKLCIC